MSDPANDLPAWPAFGLADDVRPALRRHVEAGLPCVLATLVQVDGSGPRPIGSQMVFGAAGAAGYLSGGCVEAALALQAQAVAASGEPEFVRYGKGSPYVDIQLVCGTGIGVLLERVAPEDAAARELLAAEQARRPVLWLSDGRQRGCVGPGGDPPTDLVAPAQAAAASSEQAGVAGSHLWRRFDPPWRLVVIGADPTSMAVASLGAQAGFRTVLFRPKGPEQPPPLEGVDYVRGGEVERVLEDQALDDWTAVAICTHDAELDQAAAVAALRSEAAYVGALGARRRLPDRFARLRAAGVADEDLRRLHAPIGLPLGGKAPWEIAVSILADITAFRHGRTR